MAGGFERQFDYKKAITALREQRGMTREALAAAAGISASYLYEVERGLKRPSTDVLAKLALALGMRPSEVMEYIERQPSAPTGRFAVKSFIAQPRLRREWAAARTPAEAPLPAPEPAAGKDVLRELAAIAQELDEQDVSMLLDLARRLRQKPTRDKPT